MPAPDLSDNRKLAVPGLHMDGKRVNQDLGRESDSLLFHQVTPPPCYGGLCDSFLAIDNTLRTALFEKRHLFVT